MSYTVQFMRAAMKGLEAADRDTYARLRTAIDRLASDPRPHGCEKLAGIEGHWRIRVGQWRVVYAIHDSRLLVLVVRVGHRREVYR